LEANVHYHDGRACHNEHCGHDHHHHDHEDTFSTWSYDTDIPLSLDALRDVARKLPASVYRCKGVIFSSEPPGRRAVLQVVGKRGDLTLEGEWDGQPRRSRIVAIGAHGKLDPANLTELFDRCRDTTRPTMTPA
jgi:G3E family GTPase